MTCRQADRCTRRCPSCAGASASTWLSPKMTLARPRCRKSLSWDMSHRNGAPASGGPVTRETQRSSSPAISTSISVNPWAVRRGPASIATDFCVTTLHGTTLSQPHHARTRRFPGNGGSIVHDLGVDPSLTPRGLAFSALPRICRMSLFDPIGSLWKGSATGEAGESYRLHAGAMDREPWGREAGGGEAARAERGKSGRGVGFRTGWRAAKSR